MLSEGSRIIFLNNEIQPRKTSDRQDSMQTKVTIRIAFPEDAASVSRVLYESFLEFESLYTPYAFEATTPHSDEVLERMEEGPMWVALKNDAIIGTASVIEKTEGLYIRGMAVLPVVRGQKIGRMLLEHIERFAIENGCKRLYLSTTPFLDSAIKLYENSGFKRSTEGPDNMYGTPLFTMEKLL